MLLRISVIALDESDPDCKVPRIVLVQAGLCYGVRLCPDAENVGIACGAVLDRNALIKALCRLRSAVYLIFAQAVGTVYDLVATVKAAACPVSGDSGAGPVAEVAVLQQVVAV